MRRQVIFPGAIRCCFRLLKCVNPDEKVRTQKWEVECMSCGSKFVRSGSHLANDTPAQYGCTVCLKFAKALRYMR